MPAQSSPALQLHTMHAQLARGRVLLEGTVRGRRKSRAAGLRWGKNRAFFPLPGPTRPQHLAADLPCSNKSGRKAVGHTGWVILRHFLVGWQRGLLGCGPRSNQPGAGPTTKGSALCAEVKMKRTANRIAPIKSTAVCWPAAGKVRVEPSKDLHLVSPCRLKVAVAFAAPREHRVEGCEDLPLPRGVDEEGPVA